MTHNSPSSAIEIRSFWGWFQEHVSTLEVMIDESAVSDLSSLIGSAVASLTDLIGWEVGPGIGDEYQLAFTLNGSLANLKFAQTVISYAPVMVGWEFYAGRPPKIWNLTISMLNKNGQEIQIDARNWKYTLVGFDNCSFFDITIDAPNLTRLDGAAQIQAVTIIMQGLLGEVEFLKLIDRIEVITHDGNLSDRMSCIADLPMHLASL